MAALRIALAGFVTSFRPKKALTLTLRRAIVVLLASLKIQSYATLITHEARAKQ